MMLSYYVFYVQGFIYVIMVGIKGCDVVRLSEFLKVGFSLDWGL